ncbi:cysteine desulfurase family protein [Lagierella sp.]|uniref:cysteine desulfurase family protein n=1 Tax=Lagierella sp. TaxID=2849657 RepID=UPI00260E0FED|nr:cysteine desulfurase family protein [Lagierella sp.]
MIYFDNAATTKVRQEAVDIMVKAMTVDFANPSALHSFGHRVEKEIELARDKVARALKVKASEIYFISCGTEGNNIAIRSFGDNGHNKEFITTEIEHSSVKKTYESLGLNNLKVLSVIHEGRIDLEELENSIDENTAMVSIMHVNNEIGVVNPIEEIGNIIKKKNKDCIFHVDGIQGFGKVGLDLNKAKVDIYTISGHKFHAPKGIGAMFVRDGVNVRPVITGGGQERGISSGTENVPGILALGEMCEIIGNNLMDNYARVMEVKNHLIEKLEKMDDIIINSKGENFSPYILNVSIKDVRGEVLLHYLESKEIYISTGSACNKNNISPVIKALGVDGDHALGTVRISFSDESTIEECDEFFKEFEVAVNDIRSIVGRN